MSEYGITELICNPYPVSGGSALQAVSMRDADAWHTMFGGSGSASSGVRVTAKTALGYPPLWRALNVISDDVAGMPLDVFRRTTEGNGRQVDDKHPAQALLRGTANTLIHGETVRKTITAHAMLYGNGYAGIDRDSRQKPWELTPLDPQRTAIVIEGGVVWYTTYVDNEQVKIPGRDVLHIKGLSHNGLYGHNVIDLMRDALGVGMAAQQYGGRFFGQGSNAGGLLMIPGHFNEEKIRNTMAAWEKMTTGLQQAHKVALLQDGAKFQQLTIAPEHAQFLETRNYEVRATVSNIFGIPPHMLGDDSRTSHNSLEQEDQNYLTRALNPWLKEWERECYRKLLSEREKSQMSHFIEFNRESLIQMSFTDKVQGIAKQQETGLLTVNEGRRLLNMPDVGPDGDKRYHPANWMEVGSEAADGPENPAEVPAKSAQTPDEEGDSDKAASVLRSMITSSVTNAIQIESDRVVRAAKMRKDFCGSLDGIYTTWSETFNADLGWHSPDTVVAIARHIETSKTQLLDVAGVSTTESLEANVREVVACWQDRAGKLIEEIWEAAT